MTQAMAVKEMVEAEGHRVVSVMLGLGHGRQMPRYFESAMEMPVEIVPTPQLIYKNSKAVDMPATLAFGMRHIPAYWRGVRRLQAIVRDTQPDMIFNFYETLTGIYALTTRRRPPIVAIANQFMCEHPGYTRVPGRRLEQFNIKWFSRLIGAASTRLALSLYEAPDLPEKKLFVCPPLLRRQLFELQPKPGDGSVLVYLLNHGYSEQIIQWHKAHPATVLHCFYDKPGAPPEFRHDATLTFHALEGEKFMRMMAECTFVVCTAGFDCLSEAAYLGKPLFVVPVGKHIEQQVNAMDSTRLGWGVTGSSFNLDRLEKLPGTFDNAGFRARLSGAKAVLLRTLDFAARQASPTLNG
jgi:uncharacterized protein (TIGR00661 family)